MKSKGQRIRGTKAQSGNLGSVAMGQEAEVTNSLQSIYLRTIKHRTLNIGPVTRVHRMMNEGKKGSKARKRKAQRNKKPNIEHRT